jgi:hypothetical protein
VGGGGGYRRHRHGGGGEATRSNNISTKLELPPPLWRRSVGCHRFASPLCRCPRAANQGRTPCL